MSGRPQPVHAVQTDGGVKHATISAEVQVNDGKMAFWGTLIQRLECVSAIRAVENA